MSFAQSIGYWSLVALLLCGFCFVLLQKLRAGGYSLPLASAFALGSLAEPAYFCAGALRTVLFCIVCLAMALAAAALVRRREPRPIVLLGSSLAGAQFLYPLCGAATTLVLPFALRRAFAGSGARHGMGLYIPLLFIPALTLAYQGVAYPEFTAPTAFPKEFPNTLWLTAFAPLAAALPVSCAVAVNRTSVPPPICALIAAIAAVGAAGTLLGFQQWNVAVAALAVLSAVVVGGWPDGASRERNAALLLGTNLLVAWTPVLFVGGPHA